MKNHFRLFSIFLCVILSFSFLSVNSFAAGEENLVSPDLRTWQLGSGLDSSLIDPNSFYYNPEYNYSRIRVRFPADDTYGYYGTSLIFDVPSLDVGVNYQFSFSVPTLDVVQRVFSHIDSLERYFGENVVCFVGVGYIDSNNDLVFYDNCYVTLTPENLSSFVGYNYIQSFKLDNIIGTPVFAIEVNSVGSVESYLFFQNLSVTRVSSESDKKLDGILGLLQELWNSITGGFDRVQTKIGEVITNLSGELQSVKEGITTKLGEVITNLSGVLNNVKEGITTKLGEVITNLSGVLNNVKEGITTKLGEVITGLTSELRYLGDRIINYLLYFSDEVPENPFEGVDSPLDEVQGFFDDLIDYLSNIGDDIETVIDSITGPVTLLDHFTKRFEWLFGIVTFTLMLIVVSRFIGL